MLAFIGKAIPLPSARKQSGLVVFSFDELSSNLARISRLEMMKK
jgi:hypothetical protein